MTLNATENAIGDVNGTKHAADKSAAGEHQVSAQDDKPMEDQAADRKIKIHHIHTELYAESSCSCLPDHSPLASQTVQNPNHGSSASYLYKTKKKAHVC